MPILPPLLPTLISAEIKGNNRAKSCVGVPLLLGVRSDQNRTPLLGLKVIERQGWKDKPRGPTVSVAPADGAKRGIVVVRWFGGMAPGKASSLGALSIVARGETLSKRARRRDGGRLRWADVESCSVRCHHRELMVQEAVQNGMMDRG